MTIFVLDFPTSLWQFYVVHRNVAVSLPRPRLGAALITVPDPSVPLAVKGIRVRSYRDAPSTKHYATSFKALSFNLSM